MNTLSIPKSVEFSKRESLEGSDVEASLASKRIIPLGAEQGLGMIMEAELHQHLDPETYDHLGIAFGRLKPLVRFLLTIFPEMPRIPDYSQQTPLRSVMESFSKEMFEEIVRYLCGNEANGGLASEEAIK